MTTTRELVTDKRDEYAFHDDIVYLAQTKRGLTRETVEEISAFKDEPDWMLQFRLRAYDHFLEAADAHVGRRPARYRLRQDRLLPQAVRARREVVGRRPGEDQGDVREAGDPGGRAQVPVRRRRPVRLRGRLPLRPRGADQDRRRLHGHGPGAQGIPGDLPQVLRHRGPARGQQVRGAQQRGLVGRLVRLRPQGRRGAAAAAGLLPDQRREHGPVRADADRRRRGRQGPLHRGLHGPDLRDRLAPRGRRRGHRAAGLEGSLHDDPELVATTSTTSSRSGPTRTRTRPSSGSTRTPAPADDEVPVDLPARRGRHGRHHLGRGGRQGPAPGHGRQGDPPRPEHAHPDRLASRSARTAAGPRTAARSRSRRARRTWSPASAATR